MYVWFVVCVVCWFVCWFLRLICVEFRLFAESGWVPVRSHFRTPVDLDSPSGTVFFLGEGHVLIYEVTGSTAAVVV